MKTAYEILNVPADADDTHIKQAFLQQVKHFPPEQNQARFQLIQQAYDDIKDLKSRLSYDLFTLPEISFDELINQALETTSSVHLDAEQFEELLNASIDDVISINMKTHTPQNTNDD